MTGRGRVAQTTAALAKLKIIWSNKNISVSSKIQLMRSFVTAIFLYACETWTLNADLERRIRAMEMRCFRRLLGITYRDHITNDEVKRRIKNHIGPYTDRPSHVSKTTKTEVVRTHHEISRPCQNIRTGHCARRKT